MSFSLRNESWPTSDGQTKNFETLVVSNFDMTSTNSPCPFREKSFKDRVCFNGYNKSRILYLPTNLAELFPNVEHLQFYYCVLRQLTPSYFKGLEKLKTLVVEPADQWTTLRSDVFDLLPNLEIVSLRGNNFSQMNFKVFESLKNLKYADLTGSGKIDKIYASTVFKLGYQQDQYYDEEKYKKMISMASFREMIVNNLSSPLEIGEMDKAKDIFNDITKILEVDAFKDFTIKIDDEEFKVHRIILAARSSVLADLMQNNPDAGNLNLVDISIDIFKILLDFIYKNKLPDVTENFIAIFKAAGKLNIIQLLKHAEHHLIEQINAENAYEFLKLSNLYEAPDLKLTAFNELKKVFSTKKLSEDWADQPAKLQELIDARKEKYEAIRMANEKFDAFELSNDDDKDHENSPVGQTETVAQTGTDVSN